LSLNAVNKKNEVAQNTPSIEVDLPKKPFSQADFIGYWREYIDILTKQGEKMLAAILNSKEPILEDTLIKLTYPNAMMMEEVRKNQSPILNYLREKLHNYSIVFQMSYDDSEEKNFLYRPEEKYEKFVEFNPLINEFRKKFDLDI